MSDLTEAERKSILAKVIVKFDTAYGKGLGENPEKIRQWYHQCGHLNEEAALATADACISHHRWQPTIAEFLEISRTVRRHQEDMKREAPRELTDHIKALQAKGLNVQRGLIKARAVPGRQHDHTNGPEQCPICSLATEEEHADSCRTCMILEDCGLPGQHFSA